jgi:hypothetical protein
VHIDHYVEVDLLGFYRITKAVGGVEVCLTKAQQEKRLRHRPAGGRSTVRASRRWRSSGSARGCPGGPGPDRPPAVLHVRGLRKVTSLGTLTNPIKLKRLLDAIGSSMRMDALDPLQLAGQLRGWPPATSSFTTIPTQGNGTRGTAVGGAGGRVRDPRRSSPG